MVSPFANYDISFPPRLRRAGMRHGDNPLLRRLRRRWFLEPLVLCTVLGMLVTGARAADPGSFEEPVFEPVAAPQSLWAGPYLGFETGISQTATEVTVGGRKDDASRVDAAFGLFGGYNWEVSRFVLGVEAGAAYLGGREKGRHPTLGNYETGAKWTVNAKARAGLPINNFMPYLSVGIAATEHSLKANNKEHSSVSIGPVLGGGLEVAVTDEWRIRADYSLTGIIDSKDRYAGVSARRNSANHRLMIGISRAF
ncbi:MAG: outer membrane beta-barrel protein [Roseibium sp.]|nr:outer membrane beta-barrel protein [Roseibium sp.]MBO6928084.1 outer membrane beta-barrel protein [Roseibium sp.]